MLVRIFNHDDGGIDHGADGNGDAAQRHDVGIDAHAFHDYERGKNAHRQRNNNYQRRAQVKQKQRTHQRDYNKFFEQRDVQVIDCTFDQRGAIISFDNFHACGQASGQLIEFGFYAVNGGQCIFAVTHDDDAADDFAFTVELGNAAT